VSVEAISWALNLAPVPAGRGGQPSSACKFVLVGLANHAGPDGTGAFPSVATLVRYTGLAERTVRTCLDRLAAEGIIAPCDPGIVAARIKLADRRPQGWDLNLSLARHDLNDAAVAVLERQCPGLGVRLAAAGQPGADSQADGVQSPHAVATDGEAVDNSPGGVRQLHPEPGTGCNQRADGVQPAQLRGAAAAPKPYREPSRESAAPASARKVPPAAEAAGGGGPISEFFAALGADWQLTAAQRSRLAATITLALNAGWTPQALAAFTGANTSGVRNPYAVLAARLAPAELPLAHTQRPSRPPWCGQCDERTRMLGFDGDAPRPCPRCKAQPASMQADPALVSGSTAAESAGRIVAC
jgi:Helix-turn-helix domain